MIKIPFDLYDVFGYLASGFVLLVGMEQMMGFPAIVHAEPTAIQSLLLLLAAYIAGHSVATPARALFESVVVDRILGAPAENLIHPQRRWLRLVFPGYYSPLPNPARHQILSRASLSDQATDAQTVFLRARFSSAVQESAPTMERLSKFLAQYGFARNLTFTLLVISIPLLFLGTIQHNLPLFRNGVLGLLIAALMFYRYLKFYRQYAYETFLTYYTLEPHYEREQPPGT